MNTERTSLARRSTEWWPLAVLTNIACSPSISSSESSVISAVVVTVPLATLIRWYSTMSRGFGLVIVGVLVVAILGLVDLKLFPSIGIG